MILLALMLVDMPRSHVHRDDNPPRSFYSGDSRAALAPFLAAHALQQRGVSFKWLMLVDDDTIAFPHAILRVAGALDPDMPAFVSGAPQLCSRGSACPAS